MKNLLPSLFSGNTTSRNVTRLRLGFFLICVEFMLTGCTVGPNYRRPVQVAPPDFHQSAPAAERQVVGAKVDAEWWAIYGDPLLTQLEHEVADTNLDLRATSYRYAQSIAERRIAAAAQMPNAEGNASYSRERASTNGVLGLLGSVESESVETIASGTPGLGPAAASGAVGNPAFNLPQYGLNAAWEVDLWGHVRRQVESATASMRASEDMRRGMLVSLMAETAQDYIGLRSVQAQIAVVEQDIELSRRSVGLTELRLKEGTATGLDVADARGQYHNFESRLPALKGEEIHLINALGFLTTHEPGALTARLGKPQAIPPVPSYVPVGLPSEILDRRPDIRAAEQQLHAATANIGVAASEFYPRITLAGSFDMSALQFSNLGDWASRQYGFGPTATVPIFEGGRLKGQLQLRQAQQKEAAIILQRTVLKAWQETDDAMADFSLAQKQRDRLAEAVEQNTLAVKIVQTQYSAGSADFLNVLTMQNVLLATQTQLIQASADVSLSVTRLYRSIGGGWQTKFPESAAEVNERTETQNKPVQANSNGSSK